VQESKFWESVGTVIRDWRKVCNGKYVPSCDQFNLNLYLFVFTGGNCEFYKMFINFICKILADLNRPTQNSVLSRISTYVGVTLYLSNVFA
jgi:hypothetical protein